MEACRQQH
jgi:hypothetical protein